MLFIILLVNKDAKAWLMRQAASTGILNSSISESKEGRHVSAKVSYTGLTLKNEDGTMIDVSALQNKVIFINFWASWCPPCRAEFPSVQKLYDRYRNNPEMVFLTVNLDDNMSLGKSYLKEKSFTVPFLHQLEIFLIYCIADLCQQLLYWIKKVKSVYTIKALPIIVKIRFINRLMNY
ncbi:TlpA disulfide reductase family protein [Chryseobacterium sp. 1B4]